MRRLSDEFKKPEDFITQEDKESESMKKHHDAVVYYKQRKGGEWFHGRISNAFRNGYDNIKWD
jgi:hypothetical protein